MALQVIDRRYAGIRRVYDLSVPGPRAFIAGTVAVPWAIDWMFPAAPDGLKNVHVPAPRSHVPAGTPPQLGRTMSAAGGFVAP